MVLINYNMEIIRLNKIRKLYNVNISDTIIIKELPISKRKLEYYKNKISKIRYNNYYNVIPITYEYKNCEKHRVCIIIENKNIYFFDSNGKEDSIFKERLFSLFNENIQDESIELNNTSDDCVLYTLGYIISKIKNKNYLKYNKKELYNIILNL